MFHPPRFPCFLLSLLAVVPIATADAATWYVDATAISGAGTSWKEPFHTIGEAVAAATDGDGVWVAEGIYQESVTLQKKLRLIGGFPSGGNGESNPIKYPTIIQGHQVVITAAAYIEGISVTSHSGIAIFDATETVTLNKCWVTSNSSPTSGGALIASRVSVEIQGCIFENNVAPGSGGALYIRQNSTVTLRDCVIRGNEAEAGGGIAVDRANLVMSNCRIEQNRAISLSGDNEGIAGGLYSVNSVVDVENCLFNGNIASVGNQFTGLNSQGQPITFTNCTFYTPFGGPHPQIVWARLAVPTIQNSIVMGDIPVEHLSDENLLANVTYSNIQGGYPGEGNISDDPLFRNSANGDFRLQHNSTCIDAGAMAGPADDLDGNPRPIDIPGVGREGDNAFDMGAFEFQLPIPPPDPRTDINQDGLRDATDLLLLMQDWHRVSGPSGIASDSDAITPRGVQ